MKKSVKLKQIIERIVEQSIAERNRGENVWKQLSWSNSAKKLIKKIGAEVKLKKGNYQYHGINFSAEVIPKTMGFSVKSDNPQVTDSVRGGLYLSDVMYDLATLDQKLSK